MNSQHIIHRQTWEVDISPSTDDMLLQFKLDQIARRQLTDIIEQVLNRHVPDNQYLSIEKMELQLPEIDPKDMDVFPFMPAEILNDILITEFIGNNVINFPELKGFNLEQFRQIIGNSLNDRVGREVFHDIVIGRLDYLGKEEIRSNIQQKQYDMKEGSEAIEVKEPEESS